MAIGFCYIMTHPTYDPNTYKLGRTKNEDGLLARYGTNFVEPIVVIETYPVSNDVLAERFLFDLLKEYRVLPNKEFFSCDLEIIRKQCLAVMNLFDSTHDHAGETIDTLHELLEQNKHKNIFIQSDLISISKSDVTTKKNIPKKDIDEKTIIEIKRTINNDNMLIEILLCFPGVSTLEDILNPDLRFTSKDIDEFRKKVIKTKYFTEWEKSRKSFGCKKSKQLYPEIFDTRRLLQAVNQLFRKHFMQIVSINRRRKQVKGKRKQTSVYKLKFEDTPEFFVNKILNNNKHGIPFEEDLTIACDDTPDSTPDDETIMKELENELEKRHQDLVIKNKIAQLKKMISIEEAKLLKN